MNYISAVQFLSLSQNVQQKIMKWWSPEQFDTCGEYNRETGFKDISIVDEMVKNIHDNKMKYVPLLTETQLRNYIESTIKDGINIRCDEDGYVMSADKYITCSEDLLECYLDMAVKVS